MFRDVAVDLDCIIHNFFDCQVSRSETWDHGRDSTNDGERRHPINPPHTPIYFLTKILH